MQENQSQPEPKREALTAENFHDWLDELRSRGVEIHEEIPEITL